MIPEPKPHISLNFSVEEKTANFVLDKLVSRYPDNIISKSTVRDQREWTIKMHKQNQLTVSCKQQRRKSSAFQP